MGFENVGRVWSPNTLKDYLARIEKPGWCRAITLHHCAEPSLAQRPNGFLPDHLINLRHYYQTVQRWHAGPHLFVDEDQLWGLSDLRKPGIHAQSFNSMALGIEVLGNYDVENPDAGRGLDCWQNAAMAAKVLHAWLELPLNQQTVLFHRDDPLTTKTCPGSLVRKDWVLSLIAATAGVGAVIPAKPEIGVSLQEIYWRFVGERWCVKVAEYLRLRNAPEKDISLKMKKVGKAFFYDGELLEGAFYDEGTWAPSLEVLNLVRELRHAAHT